MVVVVVVALAQVLQLCATICDNCPPPIKCCFFTIRLVAYCGTRAKRTILKFWPWSPRILWHTPDSKSVFRLISFYKLVHRTRESVGAAKQVLLQNGPQKTVQNPDTIHRGFYFFTMDSQFGPSGIWSLDHSFCGCSDSPLTH